MVQEQSLEERLLNSFPLSEKITYFTTLVSAKNIATEKLKWVIVNFLGFIPKKIIVETTKDFW